LEEPILVNKILWYIAVADPDILESEDCQGERGLYAILGLIVLVTSTFATLSSAYAFYTVFADPQIAIALGLFWGFAVATIDRFLIATTVKTNSFSIGQLISSAVRVLMAFVIGVVISAPLETAILNKEIHAEIIKRNLVEEVKLKETVSQLPESVEIARLRQENQQLRDIDAKLNTEYKQAYDALIGEGEGTSGTGKAGKGIVYGDKLTELERQKAILAKTTSQHDTKIAENDTQIEQLQKAVTTTTDRVRGSRLNADSILAQITTLHKMADENPTIAWTSRLISLAFILLDVLPILSKMLMELTNYDDIKSGKRTAVKMRQQAYIQNLGVQIAEEIRRDNAAEAEISGFLEQNLTDALKQAHDDPEMSKVVSDISLKFIQRVGDKLSQEVDRIHIPDSKFTAEAKKAVESEMQDIAKPAAKRKVVRRRIQHQVADYTRELRQAFQKFKNKY
jgi:hypothetical protein